MPKESFSPQENKPEGPKEELNAAGKSRRKFLKTVGMLAGGAVLGADAAKRIATEALRVGKFSWRKLEQEVEGVGESRGASCDKRRPSFILQNIYRAGNNGRGRNG